MTDTVAEIKEHLTIQDIVAPYVKLKRAGKSFVGLCPFHKEKTPSFHVSLERGTWHCFGCGLGGDGFSFIEKVEGVDFKGALKILAEKAGVKIEYSQDREDKSKKEHLRKLMSRASEWYAGKLAGSPAEEYAKKRGLTTETISNWRLGFAPDLWRMLLESLTVEGFTVQDLLTVGLIKEADGKRGTFYDRFRNRLLFPIRDNAGRVVAFTGRSLSLNDEAKYLNSPETEFYHKSEILFGMDFAKEAMRQRGFAMLVEGQMDALLAHQIGFGNAIALSGTALSEKHIALIKRYTENLMLVLDSDAAGLSATAKSALLALRQGLKVKAVKLPKGKDPAELIGSDLTNGKKEFSKYVTSAKPVVEFFLSTIAEQEHDPHRFVSLSEKIVLPLIAVMQSPMEREHFIKVTARFLDLSNEAVKESLQRVKKLSIEEVGTNNVPKVSGNVIRSPKEMRSEQLISIVNAYPNTPLARRVESEYCRINGVQSLPSDVVPEAVLFETERIFGENPEENAADELLRAFEEAVIREAHQKAVSRLRKVEANGNALEIQEAQSECAKISARLAALS